MITDRDEQVFSFIINYAVSEGILPTFEEIGRGVGVTSKQTIYDHVHKLENEGIIEFHGKRYKVKGLKYKYERGE